MVWVTVPHLGAHEPSHPMPPHIDPNPPQPTHNANPPITLTHSLTHSIFHSVTLTGAGGLLVAQYREGDARGAPAVHHHRGRYVPRARGAPAGGLVLSYLVLPCLVMFLEGGMG